MFRKRTEISRDLFDYLMDGRITPELERWIAASDENRRFVEDLRREPNLLRRTVSDMGYDEQDTARAWAAAARYLGNTPSRRRMPLAIRFGAIAAAAAVIFAAVMLLQPVPDGPGQSMEEPQPLDLALTAVPDGMTALVLGDGTLVPLPAAGEMSVEVEAGVTARYSNGTLTYPLLDKGEQTLNRIAVARGAILDVTFSDGSQGRFNACSDVTFPVRFSDEERRIALDGEALLDVSHDPAHPFVVVTPSGATLNVLGTTFDVAAYSGHSYLEITLMEGKVEMNNGKVRYMMEPGEHIACGVGAKSDFSATSGDTEPYSAWTRGELVFPDITLEDVMRRLMIYYDMETSYLNDQVRTERFGFKLPRYDTLDPILDFMEMTSEVRFKREGRKVYVMHKNDKYLQ